MKILIVEDDKHILSFLKRGFIEEGHTVDSCDNGADGAYLAHSGSYDVIILDWMLPQKSGIQIVQSIKEKHINTPVIMLTAKDMLEDKIEGLRTGADDYLTKPFEFDELLARVEALYRRSANSGNNRVKIQNLSIDLNAKTVKKDNKTIKLTLKEYELLVFMVKHKNALVSNSMIEEQLWDNVTYINSNVIAVTMYHLRKKIGKNIISSIRGLGYKLEI